MNHWLGDALTNSDKDMMSSAPSGATGQSGHSGGSDQSGRSGGSGQSEHSKKSEQSGQSGSDGEGKSPQSGESQTRPAEFPDAVEDGVLPVGLQDPDHQVRQDPDHVRPVGLQVTGRRGYPAGPQDLNHQVRPAGLQDPNHVRPAGPQDPHHRVRPARPQDPNHQWRPAGPGDSSHRVRTVGPQGPNHRSPCLLNSYHQAGCLKGDRCEYSHLAHADQMQAPIPGTRRSSARNRIRRRVAKLLNTRNLYSVHHQLQQEALQDSDAKDSRRSSWD